MDSNVYNVILCTPFALVSNLFIVGVDATFAASVKNPGYVLGETPLNVQIPHSNGTAGVAPLSLPNVITLSKHSLK